jgi:hypothetical protein
MSATPDLELLYARRDDLEALLFRGLGTPADWDEQRRLSTLIQDALVARLDAYLSRPWPESETITIDTTGLDDWYAQQERTDPYLQAEE